MKRIAPSKVKPGVYIKQSRDGVATHYCKVLDIVNPNPNTNWYQYFYVDGIVWQKNSNGTKRMSFHVFEDYYDTPFDQEICSVLEGLINVGE